MKWLFNTHWFLQFSFLSKPIFYVQHNILAFSKDKHAENHFSMNLSGLNYVKHFSLIHVDCLFELTFSNCFVCFIFCTWLQSTNLKRDFTSVFCSFTSLGHTEITSQQSLTQNVHWGCCCFTCKVLRELPFRHPGCLQLDV